MDLFLLLRRAHGRGYATGDIDWGQRI